MSDFPPRDRLVQVVASLVTRLPDQFGDLLSAPRFADDRGVIERLSTAEGRSQAADALAPEEAAWLAELLLHRWGNVGDVQLDPAVAIVGPDEVWVTQQPREVSFEIATHGMEDNWTAQWTGDARPSEDGREAVLTVQPPEDGEQVTAAMTVRLMGRANDKRRIIVSTRTVRVRRPVITMDESLRRLVVRDQVGAPASGVEVEVGDQRHMTQPSGLLELKHPITEDELIKVEKEAIRIRPMGSA